MSSSSSEGDPTVDLFRGVRLPILDMSQENVNNETPETAAPSTAQSRPVAGPSGRPDSAAHQSTSRYSTPRSSSIATRPAGMESDVQAQLRRAMMEGVSMTSAPSGSDRYHSHASHSHGTSSKMSGHAESIPSEAFSKPLHVRDALVRGRIRRASVGYQRFGLGDQHHPLVHETHEEVPEENEQESDGEATGTTTTTLSESSELSSTFIKCHSKGSIRAARKKHHLVHKMMKHRGEMHTIMYNFCESRVFNGFLLSVILLNTLSLGAQTWEGVRVRAGWYLDAMDNAFLGIYLMEAVIKIYVWRKLYFKDSWNNLDFSILVFNVIDYLLPIVVQNVQGFDGAAIFRMLRILRGIRAIRAFRVLRTIKFLSNLTVIMNTCLQSVQSMGAIVMLMTLFMYMFAVIGRGLYAKKDPERFGSLPATAFTLFQLLTLDEWFDIYSDMVKISPSDWPIIIYLILYIVLEYFVFLNLFVAVLVDNFQLTLEAANEAKKAKKKVLVDSDDEEDRLEISDDGSSDITGSSEISIRPPRKTIDEVYGKYTEFTQDHLNYYFQLLSSLEYNTQIISGQKKTLDMLVDLCIETNDDADQ